MIKMIMPVVIVILATSCAHNMKRTPDRWVTVIDVDANAPAENLALVYTKVKKPFFIVGQVQVSTRYITDRAGRAYVPSGVYLQPHPASGYMRFNNSEQGPSPSEMISTNVIYVRSTLTAAWTDESIKELQHERETGRRAGPRPEGADLEIRK